MIRTEIFFRKYVYIFLVKVMNSRP